MRHPLTISVYTEYPSELRTQLRLSRLLFWFLAHRRLATTTAMENLSPEYLREYSGHQLTVAAIVFIPLNIIFVAIRFFSRHLTKAPLGLDDILIIPGLILCVTLSILALCKLPTYI
jgi:hypothetical protein